MGGWVGGWVKKVGCVMERRKRVTAHRPVVLRRWGQVLGGRVKEVGC